jgi:8-oxo-dGTP diphosphatase
MTAAPAPVRVAAGILRRDERILACRRLPGGPFGLKWELPGGKLRPGEEPAEALVRELREELGVAARVGPLVERTTHTYPGPFTVDLLFFEVEGFEGEPRNLGFDAIRWAAASELEGLDWLEADRRLARRLARNSGRPLPPTSDGGSR